MQKEIGSGVDEIVHLFRILREVEERTGRAGGFIESDLVDPRYFSAANIKNRIESYLQMVEQKRSAGVAV